MTKTYPEGTKWTVKLPAGAFPSKKYPDTDQSKPGQPRYEDVCRYGALACLNHWRARSGAPDAIVLVRIPPPRPKRSVEERIAEAVKAAVDAAVRERTEVILAEWQAPWSESKRRPFDQHFAEWLRDLRDGKVK